MSLRSTLFALSSAAMFSMVGCAVTPEQPESKETAKAPTVQEGLTVLKASDTALSVAFKRDSIVVYLEAVRGKLTPADYQADPESPKYEMDARFMADDGHYFWVQRGGDEFVDPTWQDDLGRQDNLPEPKVSNRVLFEMASDAIKVLPSALAVQFPAERLKALAPEMDTLTRMGAKAPALFTENFAQLAAQRAAKGLNVGAEVAYGTGGPESAPLQLDATAYYMDVYQKKICEWWNFCITGHHSATRTWRWNGSSWATLYDMCNHGSCPGNMSYVCRTTGNYLWKNAWNISSCRTGYDGISNGGHNCHDDTRVQQASFAEDRYNDGWGQWCNNGDHSSDISGGTEQGGYPNCNAGDSRKGYAY